MTDRENEAASGGNPRQAAGNEGEARSAAQGRPAACCGGGPGECGEPCDCPSGCTCAR